MPHGDHTGPLGQGPGTGRAFGPCYGIDTPGYTKGSGGRLGRGFNFGRGRGSGRGRSFGGTYTGSLPGYPWMSSVSKEDEIKLLKNQADALNRSQKDIEKRLAELEKEKE
jgi:hypothetical protein